MKKGHLFLLTVFTAGLLIFTSCCKKGTEPEEKLAAPVLDSPTNGEAITTVTPTLKWLAVKNAVNYEAVVDTSSDFSNPEFSSPNVEDTECTTDTLSSGLHYWRVRAKNGEWSEVWQFTIDTELPAAPALNTPSNGLIIVDKTYIPTFDWDDVGDVFYYELIMDSSNSFSDPLIDESNLTSSTYTASNTFPDATYYWKVRCRNAAGNWSEWSETWLFILLTTLTDIDGNVYKLVKIGNQIWMAENLKVTHYRNGGEIPSITDGTEWSNLATGAYCNYDNDEGNIATYGRLYNWYAVNDSRGLAPAGWHVPSDEEWKELEMYLGMTQSEADSSGSRGINEGGKLKEVGTVHWVSPNIGATNESGFTALPGGFRSKHSYFNGLGTRAWFWTLTFLSVDFTDDVACFRVLTYESSKISRNYQGEQEGYSVRCIRD